MEKRYGEGFVVLFIKYVFKKGLNDVDVAHLITIKRGSYIHHETIKYWRSKLANNKKNEEI